MSLTAKFDFIAIDKFSAPVRVMKAAAEKMDAALYHIERTLNNATHKLDTFAASAKKAGTNMRNMGTNMTAAFTLPIAGAGIAAIKASANFESMTTNFEIFTKDAAKSKQLMQDIQQYGMISPFETMQLGEVGKQLLGVGVPIDQVMKKMKVLGDIAAGSGKDINQLTAIYDKGFVKNKVNAGLLNQMAAAGIPIFQELAKHHKKDALGHAMTAQAFYDMARRGKLTFAELENSMKGLTAQNGIYHDAVIRQSKTTFGLYSTLKDSITMAGISLGDTLISTLKLNDAMADLSNWVQDIAKSFAQWAKAHPTLAKIVVYFTLFLAVAGPLLMIVGQITLGVAGLAIALGFMGGLLGALIAPITLFGITFSTAIWPITLIVAGLAALYFGLKHLADSDMGRAFFDGLFGGIDFCITKIKDLWEFMKNLPAKIKAIDWTGILSKLVDELNPLKGFGEMLGGAAFDLTHRQEVGVKVDVSGSVAGAKTITKATVNRGRNM